MDKKKKISWVFQIIAAIILLPLGILKFTNGQTDVFIFTQLGMEPFGRYLIGILEILSGLCLLSKNLSVSGGVLGFGIMCGAVLAHMSVLGFSILGDNGLHILLLCLVSISCLVAIYIRRRELPIIGNLL